MRKLMALFCTGFLGLLAAGEASAASGTAIGVDPDAEARGRTSRSLVVGSDIFIGDRIVTDAGGLVQIVFSDTTRLVVGPRSSLVIDDYLIRDNGSAGKFAVQALSGTFRFISGDARKDRYLITTPTGQIGVRGTTFDLFVDRGASYVMQLRGATINCSGGECETLKTRCEVVEMARGGVENLGKPGAMRSSERREAREWFPMVVSQRALMRPFRDADAENCLRGVSFSPSPSLGDINILRRNNNNGSSDSID